MIEWAVWAVLDGRALVVGIYESYDTAQDDKRLWSTGNKATAWVELWTEE